MYHTVVLHKPTTIVIFIIHTLLQLLGVGQLTMRYDDDVFGARIIVTTDCDDILAEHIIAIQTTMHQEGNSATWNVLNLRPDPPGHATFKATFFSQEAIDMFAKSFLEVGGWQAHRGW